MDTWTAVRSGSTGHPGATNSLLMESRK